MRLIRISDGNTSGAEEFGPGGAAGMQDGYNSDGRLDSPRGVAFFPQGCGYVCLCSAAKTKCNRGALSHMRCGL